MTDMKRLLNKPNEVEELQEEIRTLKSKDSENEMRIKKLEEERDSLRQEVKHLDAELRGYRQGWLR